MLRTHGFLLFCPPFSFLFFFLGFFGFFCFSCEEEGGGRVAGVGGSEIMKSVVHIGQGTTVADR